MTKLEIANLIDHTLLKAEAAQGAVRKLCAEAREYGFAAVCVNPYYVAQAAQELAGTAVKVASVVGFPLGASTPEAKVFEACSAVKNGAAEIDMVINVGALKSGNTAMVGQEIGAVVEETAGVDGNTLVKVIIETCYLTEDEKVAACRLAKAAGAHFVKTSTGFGSGGATVADVSLMRQTVGREMGVKASGGVRTLADLKAMVGAGANRIGTSSGVKIIEEL